MAYLPDPGGFDLLLSQLKAQGRLGWGRTYWVNNGTAMYGANGAADGNDGLSWKTPMLTINAAMDRCVASRGDNIICVGDHAETIDAAADIAIDTAGVTLMGLKVGALVPTLTWSTLTTATMTITAANCTIDGFKCLANVDELATMMSLSSAGTWCTIRNCEFRLTDATNGSSVQAIAGITNLAAGLTVEDCKFWGLGAAAATGGTLAVTTGALDDVTIQRCFMFAAFTAGSGGVANSAAAARLRVLNNIIINNTTNSTKAFTAHGSTTGIHEGNRYGILSGTAPWTAAGMYAGLNYYAAAVNTAMTVI